MSRESTDVMDMKGDSEPSEPTKRIVRQEAFFGCVICGNPIIEYAHLIPYPESQDNSPRNLVSLCPTDHYRYDQGAISRDKIRKWKKSPFNKGRDVKDKFDIEGTVPIIEAGTNVCKNTPLLLVVDNKNIVTLFKEKDELLLNALFYDSNNTLLAYVENNEWHSLSNVMWDIQYSTVANQLIMRTAPRNIILRLRIKEGIVNLAGQLYYNGFRVLISPQAIKVGNKVCTMKQCTFENCISAIVVETQDGSIGIGSSVHEHEYITYYVLMWQKYSTVCKPFFIMKECRFCKKILL